jgi:hypothetical protein
LDKNAAPLFHSIIHKLSTASAELYAQHFSLIAMLILSRLQAGMMKPI